MDSSISRCSQTVSLAVVCFYALAVYNISFTRSSWAHIFKPTTTPNSDDNEKSTHTNAWEIELLLHELCELCLCYCEHMATAAVTARQQGFGDDVCVCGRLCACVCLVVCGPPSSQPITSAARVFLYVYKYIYSYICWVCSFLFACFSSSNSGGHVMPPMRACVLCV